MLTLPDLRLVNWKHTGWTNNNIIMVNYRILYWVLMLSVGAASSQAQLANDYPNDVGIEDDPNVLYVEKFDDGLDNVFSRYTDILNADGMSLDADLPPGSLDGRSIMMTVEPGVNNGGHLFRNFEPGYDGTVYIRYYVKYPTESKGFIHHEGVWFGGFNPSLPWPHPRAGQCGLGDSRLSVSFEPVWHNTDPPGMDTYLYWGDMKSWNDGSSCFGNVMLTQRALDYGQPPMPGTYPTVAFDEWMCVEMMIKLNDPVSEYNGELAIWVDGDLAGHWGPGFPNGHWLKDKWYNNPNDPPFEGFRWRTNPDLLINWIWIEFFHSNPSAPPSYIKYDHIVVAKEYIGPIYETPTKVASPKGEDKELHIFPNPGYGSFTVNVASGYRTDTPSDISVFNAMGDSVYSTFMRDKTVHLSLEEIPPGVYFVRLTQGNKVLTKKIILQ